MMILEDGFYWQHLLVKSLKPDGFYILNCQEAQQAKSNDCRHHAQDAQREYSHDH